MGRCWTCGSQINGYGYTCGVCRGIQATDSLEQTMERGLRALQESVVSGLTELASVLEWGFGELRWQLQKQTQVLQSIDQTLRTPSETKANEWRLHAEELRRRGVFDESEEFFLKALNEYRLDYRIYLGLAETYLQMSKFDRAKTYLEKSLPHAPTKDFDYRSYSYRLIGHIQFCQEDFHGAVESLHSAISLSPDYPDGLYDFAQYSCLLNDQEVDNITSETFLKWGGNWAQRKYDLIRLLCVQKAISAKPLYFYLAQRQRNFEAQRDTIRLALANLLANASGRVGNAIGDIERLIPEVDIDVSSARRAFEKSNVKEGPKSIGLLNEAKTNLKLAKEKLVSNDYLSLLNAQPLTDDIIQTLNKARDLANQETEQFRKIRSQKVSKAWARVPAAILGWPLLFGVIGVVATGVLAIIYMFATGLPKLESGSIFWVGLYVGLLAGFFYGIYNIVKALE